MLFRNALRSIVVILLVAASPGCMDDPYEDLPDPLFQAYSGSERPGAAVMVIRNGEILLRETFGMADIDNSVKVTPDTNFRLASVTKQFTAMSILLLVDEGLLTLDQPVRSILPELDQTADDITIRHLLQHQSGLPDYESLLSDSFEGQVLDADVLQMVAATDTLYFSPGTRYSYSNTGYSLLSLIVERTSGQTFPDFLESRIFSPLGMSGSVAFISGINAVSNRAYGYSVSGDTITFRDQSTTSAVLGDGGIYSSINDLFLWDQALYTEELIPESLMTLAFTPGLSGYGFGWRIETHAGRVRYSHTGSTSGFRNVIHRYPDDELTVIILTNRAGPDVTDLAEAVALRYF